MARSAAIGVVALLVACGTTSVEDRSPAPSTEASEPEPLYSCFSDAYPESTWAERRPANRLDHPGRGALQDAIQQADLRGWSLLSATDEQVTVVRELAEPYIDMIRRTHEIVSVRLVNGAWTLSQWSECAPHRVLDGLGDAELFLAGPPDPGSTELALLVMEIGCASGEDARGRTRLVSLEETDQAVEILIGVVPRDGAQNCPSNPTTPVTVSLSAPIGDRHIIDVSVWPPARVDLSQP